MRKKSRVSTAAEVILIAGFLGTLWLPLTAKVCHWDEEAGLNEKRTLARRPVLGVDPIGTFPAKLDAFCNDHFPYRASLIRWHNLVKVKGLRTSTTEKVVLGKGEWLFFAGNGGQILDYQGLEPLTPAQLAQYKNVLQGKRAWLAERGVHYLFVVAPNKVSIHPEYLPDSIAARRARTRFGQLVDYLQEHSDLDILDLRPALRQAKSTGAMFYPNDTHWNDRGAIVGYQQVCRRLARWFPEIKPCGLDDFRVVRRHHPGDLPPMLGLGRELAAHCELLIPRTPRTARPAKLTLPANHHWLRRPPSGWPGHARPLALEKSGPTLRLLVFQDSFFNRAPRECLAEHFGRSVFIHERAKYHHLRLLVGQERPDVVIEEWAERFLKYPPGDHPRFVAARRAHGGVIRR